jgi:hypothetical protein
MRYLNLSSHDYANMAYNNAKALRSVGVLCDSYSLHKHPFHYTEQSFMTTKSHIKSVYKDYDVVQIFHSCPIITELVRDHPHLVVYHSGTRYRRNPRKCNFIYNPIVKFTVTDHTEFMKLGAKNISYLAPHTELEPIEKHSNGKLIIGHYPSNPEVKGTRMIREMLEPFHDDFEIRIDERRVSHENNLERIGQCHIYVELYKPELHGRPYGCYGVTAFEAAALGCYVVTNNWHPKVYHDVYGHCHFGIANTPGAFHEQIKQLKTMSEHRDNLLTHKDFYEKHSLQATGNRILKITQ